MAQGAPIDASIRRAALVNEARGFIMPDSNTKLAETPQLVMDPGVERLSLKFEDGLGLTDAYGNVYEGYGKGGYNFIWTHKGNGLNDPDYADAADIPESIVPATVDAGLNGDTLVYNSGTNQYEPVNLNDTIDTGIDNAVATDTVAQAVVKDYIGVFIERPTAKTYKLINNLPWAITITATDSEFGTGSGTVTFPSGTLAAGSDVSITLSALSGALDLTARIDFTRNLND